MAKRRTVGVAGSFAALMSVCVAFVNCTNTDGTEPTSSRSDGSDASPGSDGSGEVPRETGTTNDATNSADGAVGDSSDGSTDGGVTDGETPDAALDSSAEDASDGAAADASDASSNPDAADASGPSCLGVSGCVLRLRGDLGVTQNGGSVSAWADQSGSNDPNKNLSQASAAQQPTWVQADPAFNSQSTLTFASDNQLPGIKMISGTWSATFQIPSMWYVVSSVTNLTRGVMVFGPPVCSGNSGQTLFRYGPGGGASFLSAGVGQCTSGSQPAIDGAKHVVAVAFYDSAGTAKADFYIDGISTAAGSFSVGSSAQSSMDVLQVGGAANDFTSLTIADVVAYSGSHSAAERGTIMNALGTRYAIPVAP